VATRRPRHDSEQSSRRRTSEASSGTAAGHDRRDAPPMNREWTGRRRLQATRGVGPRCDSHRRRRPGACRRRRARSGRGPGVSRDSEWGSEPDHDSVLPNPGKSFLALIRGGITRANRRTASFREKPGPYPILVRKSRAGMPRLEALRDGSRGHFSRAATSVARPLVGARPAETLGLSSLRRRPAIQLDPRHQELTPEHVETSRTMSHESFLQVWVLNTPNHGAKLSLVNNVSGNDT